MIKFLYSLIVVSWTSLVVVSPTIAETFLVEDGKAAAEIVIADNAPRSVRFAAHELQTYVEKISGARLPIVNPRTGAGSTGKGPIPIYVGESKAVRPANDPAPRMSKPPPSRLLAQKRNRSTCR